MATPPNENLGKWRSVELECVFKTLPDFTAFRDWWTLKLTPQERDFCQIKGDGSIDAAIMLNGVQSYGVPREIVVTYCSGKDGEKFLTRICKKLNEHAVVNNTCGTHVHFDMRHVSREEAMLYSVKVAVAVSALRLMLPKSRRRNYFCQDSVSLETGNRYSFVNFESYAKYKTVEIRGHSGTLQADKILNWTKIVERVMYNKSSKAVGSISGLVKEYKLPKKLAAYAIARGKQFRGNDTQEGT